MRLLEKRFTHSYKECFVTLQLGSQNLPLLGVSVLAGTPSANGQKGSYQRPLRGLGCSINKQRLEEIGNGRSLPLAHQLSMEDLEQLVFSVSLAPSLFLVPSSEILLPSPYLFATNSKQTNKQAKVMNLFVH